MYNTIATLGIWDHDLVILAAPTVLSLAVAIEMTLPYSILGPWGVGS